MIMHGVRNAPSQISRFMVSGAAAVLATIGRGVVVGPVRQDRPDHGDQQRPDRQGDSQG
jgi:hypothetical protein